MPAAGAIGLSHQLYCIYLVFHLFNARYLVWLFFVKRFLVRLYFYPNLYSREQCCLPTTGLIKISLLVVIINMCILIPHWMKPDFCLYIHYTFILFNIIQFIRIKLFYYDFRGQFLIWSLKMYIYWMV